VCVKSKSVQVHERFPSTQCVASIADLSPSKLDAPGSGVQT
jgi:hypothetical protein